ncbi:hypothetical protein Acr_25g0003280 [Actinidia rufa]|uniref:Uncharacterized protein n=1 Tax=Actinidia rufa TaxID=165716 RepID=A0A7J0GYM1_9ERIC|nr:hypothetical protein Acr_25g0003280 [Actinidia rufa]
MSSSDLENSDDLALVPLQPMGEDVIAHSFKEDSDSDTSSGKVDMAPRFRTLGHKKAQASTNPSIASVPPSILDHPLAHLPIFAITAPSEVESSLFEALLLDKHKGEMLVELWKPDFAITKLGKQLTMADSTKDHDISLALA